MKKRVTVLALCLVIIFSLAACNSSSGSSSGGAIGQAQGAPANTGADSDLPQVVWKMVSVWGTGNIHYLADLRFSELVSQFTDGKFKITNYGEGELCSAGQCFDYVQEGTVQASGDCAVYWTGKDSAFELLSTTCDNFSGMDYYIWINEGGGMDAYQTMFGKYNMVYFPITVHWSESGIRSSKPITSIADMQKMKIRMGGAMGAKVCLALGISTVSVPGSEIYESMQRSVIDACEFSTPYADNSLKLQEVAKYWATPCWYQSAGVNGVMINSDAWNELPEQYQLAIETAAKLTRGEMLARYMWNDCNIAVQMIEEDGVTVTVLDDESLETIGETVKTVYAEEAAKNPNFKMVLDSMNEYRASVDQYRGMLGSYAFGFVKEID